MATFVEGEGGFSATQEKLAAERYLGIGPSFPLRKTQSGYVLTAFGKDLVKQSIEQIIMTSPYERPHWVRGGVLYGTRTRQALFDDFETARDLIVADVTRALSVWEPRIEVLVVEVTEMTAPLVSTDGEGIGLSVRVDFRYRASGEDDYHVIEIPKETIP